MTKYLIGLDYQGTKVNNESTTWNKSMLKPPQSPIWHSPISGPSENADDPCEVTNRGARLPAAGELYRYTSIICISNSYNISIISIIYLQYQQNIYKIYNISTTSTIQASGWTLPTLTLTWRSTPPTSSRSGTLTWGGGGRWDITITMFEKLKHFSVCWTVWRTKRVHLAAVCDKTKQAAVTCCLLCI